MRVNVDEQAVCDDYSVNKLGLVALQKKYGPSKATIRKILAKNGVTIRPRGRPRTRVVETSNPEVTSEVTSSHEVDHETPASPFSVGIGKSDSHRSF
jgi:hypothetical protein